MTQADGVKPVAARNVFEEAAIWINANVPESHERSTAVDKLRESMFWSDAATKRGTKW